MHIIVVNDGSYSRIYNFVLFIKTLGVLPITVLIYNVALIHIT